ncbi:MAG TPA: hypothetical protein VFH99_03495 [Candidatus Saccharimonadales bacterium]|nr:hypothetical protein [Candidatus Saccharimonadales bacterium]
MATVYDPDKQGEQRYHPPNLDPLDNQPAGDSSDPRTTHKNPSGNEKAADGDDASSSSDTTSRSGLRDAESRGLFNPHDKGNTSGKTSPSSLRGAESGGDGFNFNPGKSGKTGGGFKNFFLGSTKRRRFTIGGGVVGGMLAGGSILSLFLVAGPAQLVQLSQLLQHNFSVSQSDSESRTNNLLRSYKAYKTGDFRYTRVGLIGVRSMNKIVGQFKDAGVEFTGSSITGRPTAIEVKRSVAEENFPETKGMSDAEFNDFLNGKFDVDPGLSFETAETGKSYKLDIKGLKAQSIKGFINKASTQILGNGKAITGIKTRNLKNFFGLDSLFHPFSTAIQNKINAKATEIQKNSPDESEGDAKEKAASEVADSEFSDNTSTIQEQGVKEGYEPAKAADDSFSQKVGSKLLPGLGVLWAGGCTLNGLSDAIVFMNRDLVVLPSAVEATSLIAKGSHVQNGGNDITMDQVGATVKGFKDSQGQTIWSGAALQATEGSNKADSLHRNSNGEIENNLPGEYQQAFGTDSTASTLKSVSDIMLSWFPLHYASGVIPGGQCGLIAGSTIIVAGAFTQIALAIANAPDGEAGDIALQGAARAGEDVGQGYVQGKLLGPTINNLIDRIAKATVAPKLTRETFSGALGGNLIAYGARAAANSSAILNGGLALGNASSTIIGSVGHEQQQQFHSENFFARMFDVNDYRSLAGHLATDISPGAGTNLQLGVNNTLNIGSTLTSIFSNLLPRVAAAGSSDSWTGSYDWGFPQYGIPDHMLNDPALSDPPQNAENVGQYLSSVCADGSGDIGPDKGACGSDNGYTARIMNCFGDQLTYTDDSDVGTKVWDVQHAATATTGDINPVSDSYQGANCGGICPGALANCGNSAEKHWEKIVMFVNDAFNIKALDCAGGNTDTSDQSCQDTGNGQSDAGSIGSTDTATGNFTNPFPGGWTPNRLDMGYDGTFKGQIVAPFDGTVTYAGPFTGWSGSSGVIIKADNDVGLATKSLYFTEGVAPITSLQGKHVAAGTPIANAAPSPYGVYTGESTSVGAIEWGVSEDGNIGQFVDTEAIALGAHQCPASTSQSKAMVLNFAQWAQKQLGLPPPTTTNDAGCA